MPKTDWKILEQLERVLELLLTIPKHDSKLAVVVLEIEKTILSIKLDLLTSKKVNSSPIGFVADEENRTERNKMKDKIVKLLTGKKQMTSSEIYSLFPDINKRNIRRLLDELVEEGKVDRLDSKNPIVFRVTKTFTKPL